MAQYFEQIVQSINNSELRVAIEKLFDIIGIGRGDANGSVSMSGTLTGNVTGNLTGDVTGDLTGVHTGTQTGEQTKIQPTLNTYATDTVLTADFLTSFIELDGTSADCIVSDWTPTKGKMYVITCKDATNTVSLTGNTGVTYDGTNDIATFDAAGETLVVFAISATRLVIIENIGSVALSATP